ncbi:MAG: TrbG/VirB9 family P-type conjugative transfer protein [Achromobacter pulmonis]
MVRKLVLTAALAVLAGCAPLSDPGAFAGPAWRVGEPAAHGFHFDWRLSGDAAVAPMQVFDDGRETWLQFAPGQAVPAIFGVGPGGERVLPYARRPPYLVLAGSWEALTFRGGRLAARAQRVSDGDGRTFPKVQAADNPL